ncbi:unnamed protein product [Periconia digitata]|uniref:Uncharacterized protein n=1 Tax=Periconia digitata TaxID=1303443 RepID=A0A9W4XKD1_9PLEO|nr:unnamed protein product [Periconia digitata]
MDASDRGMRSVGRCMSGCASQRRNSPLTLRSALPSASIGHHRPLLNHYFNLDVTLASSWVRMIASSPPFMGFCYAVEQQILLSSCLVEALPSSL